ncbi:U7 snRNA-associated Sm-like protein LSm10 isoform X2 [Vespa velutina]|uniref:U7 snRNA-associated Sm-like protein LSm10 isoform X2 n=1 Tax=Vespa crabro TaxID=7445 RepID=UPI001F00F0F6|nr:U7 snRNA-associated Sm-like protein LSm10 isoform X2 [Vespa crabro]XP_047371007.1 U7 snRNA-associated Sm-like protein LSm10 isoform X2 [Vespa velutina]
MYQNSPREKYYFYNSLSILLKALENKQTTIDLRNEASVYGTIEHVDAYMNVMMKDCLFTDPRGDKFPFEMFFVQARNIRFVQIPPKVRIIPAIKDQLQQLNQCKSNRKDTKRTFKEKRVQLRQQEGVLAVQNMLETKKAKEPKNSKDE